MLLAHSMSHSTCTQHEQRTCTQRAQRALRHAPRRMYAIACLTSILFLFLLKGRGEALLPPGNWCSVLLFPACFFTPGEVRGHKGGSARWLPARDPRNVGRAWKGAVPGCCDWMDLVLVTKSGMGLEGGPPMRPGCPDAPLCHAPACQMHVVPARGPRGFLKHWARVHMN